MTDMERDATLFLLRLPGGPVGGEMTVMLDREMLGLGRMAFGRYNLIERVPGD
jgi:hypothetical protein